MALQEQDTNIFSNRITVKYTSEILSKKNKKKTFANLWAYSKLLAQQ